MNKKETPYLVAVIPIATTTNYTEKMLPYNTLDL